MRLSLRKFRTISIFIRVIATCTNFHESFDVLNLSKKPPSSPRAVSYFQTRSSARLPRYSHRRRGATSVANAYGCTYIFSFLRTPRSELVRVVTSQPNTRSAGAAVQLCIQEAREIAGAFLRAARQKMVQPAWEDIGSAFVARSEVIRRLREAAWKTADAAACHVP